MTMCTWRGCTGCTICMGDRFAAGLSQPVPAQSVFDITSPCADCPADDYLTIARVMASEIDALQSELDATKDTLQCVLDHVKWDSIPACLVDDIDAIFDGNVDEADD